MNRRKFISTSALGLAALPMSAAARPGAKPAQSPGLLTVTGAGVRANRGPLDPALDQMMHKHAIKFDRAHVFDFAAITALPAVPIKPTLEYDAKPHVLSGPLLSDIVVAAGIRATPTARLLLRAVDGYAVYVSVADANKYRFIVATHLDGAPMPLGGLGPLWALYDADRFPESAAKPLSQRFAQCPWALYHIDVQV